MLASCSAKILLVLKTTLPWSLCVEGQATDALRLRDSSLGKCACNSFWPVHSVAMLVLLKCGPQYKYMGVGPVTTSVICLHMLDFTCYLDQMAAKLVCCPVFRLDET